jgi:HAD superfamily hydrolase (TIGR01509 family)
MSFDAILFDCDGVLVDSEVVGLEDSAEFLRDNGFDWTTEDLIRRFTGMRTDRFAAGLRAAYADVLTREPSDPEFDALIEGLIATRRAKRHTMAVVAGAHEAVAEAAAKVAGVAVASSSAKIYLDDKIDRFGFRAAFGGHVYSADEVAHGKPAPDIFLHAAAALGTPPERCLVVEDSPHGVAAGVAAGMTVWGFTGGGHCLPDHAARLRAEGAGKILADHAELRAAFSTLR